MTAAATTGHWTRVVRSDAYADQLGNHMNKKGARKFNQIVLSPRYISCPLRQL